MKIDYRAEVKKVYPAAKVYHTATILGGWVKVYHVGVQEGDTINIITPSGMWAGNSAMAWKHTYKFINNQTT